MDFGSAKNAYHSKLGSLTSSLRELYDDKDELIEIMRDDPVSERFIPNHIEELFASRTRTEKDREVEMILSELNSTQESLNEVMRQRSMLAGSLKNKQESEGLYKERSQGLERQLVEANRSIEELKRSLSRLSLSYESKLKQALGEISDLKLEGLKEVKEAKKSLEAALRGSVGKDIELVKLAAALEKEISKSEALERQLDETKRELRRREAHCNDTDSRLQTSIKQSSNVSSSLQIAQEQIDELSHSLADLQSSKEEQEQKFLEFYSQVKKSLDEEQLSHLDSVQRLKQRLGKKLQKLKNKLANSEVYRVELEEAFNKCSSELQDAKFGYEQLLTEHQDKLAQFERDAKLVESAHSRQVEELKSRQETELQHANRQFSQLIEQKIREFQQETASVKAKAREREQDITDNYEQRIRSLTDSMLTKAEHLRLVTLAENQLRESLADAHSLVIEDLRQEMLKAERAYQKRFDETRAESEHEISALKKKLNETETQNLLIGKDLDKYSEQVLLLSAELKRAHLENREQKELLGDLSEKLEKSQKQEVLLQKLIDSLSVAKAEVERERGELARRVQEVEMNSENRIDETFAELKSLRNKTAFQRQELEEQVQENEKSQELITMLKQQVEVLVKEKQSLAIEYEELKITSTDQALSLRADAMKKIEAAVLESENTKAASETLAMKLAKASSLLLKANEKIAEQQLEKQATQQKNLKF